MGARRDGRAHAGSIAALVVLLGLGASACGDRWSSDAPPPGRFGREDLARIVLGAADAPQGTAYVHSVSGFQDLGAFARDAAELTELRSDGFRIGHLALFFPADHVTDQGRSSPLTASSVIVQGITGLFRSAGGANDALLRFVDDLRDRQLPGSTSVDSIELGDRSFELMGETPDGSQVSIFAWRVDNLVLAVSGSGAIDVAAIRALADLLDDRADVIA